MTRLDRLLAEQGPLFERLARRYMRRSWHVRAVDYNDYLQDAYVAAIDCYRRHVTLSNANLGAMMHKAVLYRLERIWRQEVFTGEVLRIGDTVRSTPVYFVDLSASMAAPDSLAFRKLYFSHAWDETLTLLTDLQRSLLDALVLPEPDSASLLLCHDLFTTNHSAPIQAGEFWYLATLFNLPVERVKAEFYAIRNRIVPILDVA